VPAVTARRAWAAGNAGTVTAHATDEIMCSVTVPGAAGPGAAVTAMAVVTEALTAWFLALSPSR
jgi:hypothetical protein